MALTSMPRRWGEVSHAGAQQTADTPTVEGDMVGPCSGIDPIITMDTWPGHIPYLHFCAAGVPVSAAGHRHDSMTSSSGPSPVLVQMLESVWQACVLQHPLIPDG